MGTQDMLGSLIKRERRNLEFAVGEMVHKALVAALFFVAACFGTAALALYWSRLYGAETAYIMLAALFAGIGLLAALFMALPRKGPALDDSPLANGANASTAAPEDLARGYEAMTEADKELLKAALMSAAPVAVPGLIRIILKNLPLIAVIAGVVAMVIQGSKSAAEAPSAEPAPAPAE